jgi:hypothetical protein
MVKVVVGNGHVVGCHCLIEVFWLPSDSWAAASRLERSKAPNYGQNA